MKSYFKLMLVAVVLVISSMAAVVFVPGEVEDNSTSDLVAEPLQCLSGAKTCGGNCDIESSSCGSLCVKSLDAPCNCPTGEIPNSGVITCSASPSMF